MTSSADAAATSGGLADGIGSAVLSVDDSRWPQALEGSPHDIYQVPEYLAFSARHQVEGSPVAFLVWSGDHRLLVPLIVRALPPTERVGRYTHDATSPRGFAGPIVGPADSPGLEAFVAKALERFVADLRREGIVSAFVRPHPLVGPTSVALAKHGTLVGIGDSFSIDLGRSEDELWSLTRNNHRRDIRRATKSGYRARIDDDWARFDDFIRAFDETMARLDAAPHWRLPRDYFEAFRSELGDRVHLAVVEDDGGLAAACLVTETDGIAEFHLAGTPDDHVAASPSKLLIHFLTGWSRTRGNRILHLAGTPRPNDSLGHFKAGFATERRPMQTWRVVADAAAYDTLVGDREGRSGGEATSADGYFPAYREPSEVRPGDA